ncbi:GNAT family N-acetyltransferase [Serratia fonticola]|uniref:GNAT family N-acetyltransferase n=1 Tax=Serratia fonticola TaxID=47917 RepID=UPI002DB8F006|nr:GNAT family N-acetyltransferase [Serratia fonticola]MEB7883776.1 GNAT family N-acetyltransferase [Serratia fonticola]
MEISWQALKGNLLSAQQLHDILALRMAVFVVEQTCPFQDIDGQDLLNSTLHVAGYSDSKLVAYARVLHVDDSPDAAKITRVIVDDSVRGQKLGVRLMEKTMSLIHGDAPGKAIKLSAQSHLVKFYEGFGFKTVSGEYLDDGIPHKDMEYKDA